MVVIDTNALVVLIVGLIDPKQLPKHRRTSAYDEEDFKRLLQVVKDFTNLVVLPNVWTEVDNILNKHLRGNFKWPYIQYIKKLTMESTEKYLESVSGVTSDYFINVGLTDSLVLELAKKCDLIITADSDLSDLARAHSIMVYDLVYEKNLRLRT